MVQKDNWHQIYYIHVTQWGASTSLMGMLPYEMGRVAYQQIYFERNEIYKFQYNHVLTSALRELGMYLRRYKSLDNP